MTTSGNPAKKAAAKKTAAKKTAAKKTSAPKLHPAIAQAAQVSASDVSAFKSRSQGIALPLPSGLVVEAKRVELKTFIMQGNIPNSLMEVVSKALDTGKAADVDAMLGVEKGEVDLETINEMYSMVDDVLVASVIKPPIHHLPEDNNEVHENLLYTIDVDDEDKMFIFQWAVGGTSDIATFRLEAGSSMDALAKK